MNTPRDIVGREVATGAFTADGRIVGGAQAARVVRATRACVTLQRAACGGWWHTGTHGRVVVSWRGVERASRGVLTTRVWPPHMVELRIAAGLGRLYFDVAFDGGRIA